MTKKILFVVNVDWFFVSHRLPIALACIENGFEVHIACATTGQEANLKKLGIFVHSIPLKRGTLSPVNFIRCLVILIKLLRSIRFNIVHLVAIQSVILGGLSSRILGISPLIISISGLGYVFTGDGISFLLKRKLITLLLKLSFGVKKKHIIFQNIDDANLLIDNQLINKSEFSIIHGSGVSIKNFYYQPILPEKTTFIMVSRLLKDKGVMEFCEAARQFTNLGYKADFYLVGEIDSGNPASLTNKEKELLPKVYGVNLLGYREDIDYLMAGASVVVLPSYREGFPKVLIEAAAAGRAVITSNVPGCRDAVVSESAILINSRDVGSLRDAMIYLSDNQDKIESMGVASRKLAMDKFDISHVVNQHINIYDQALNQ